MNHEACVGCVLSLYCLDDLSNVFAGYCARCEEVCVALVDSCDNLHARYSIHGNVRYVYGISRHCPQVIEEDFRRNKEAYRLELCVELSVIALDSAQGTHEDRLANAQLEFSKYLCATCADKVAKIITRRQEEVQHSTL